MDKDKYTRYMQSQVEDAKRRWIHGFVVSCLALILSIIAAFFFFTNGFRQMPANRYELLSPVIAAIALLVAFIAYSTQRASLKAQIEDSKRNISSMIESSAQMKDLIHAISVKNELGQIAFRERSLYAAINALSVDNDSGGVGYHGKEFFKYIFLECPYECFSYPPYDGLWGFLKGAGHGAYSKSESLPVLNPYFELFYDLVEFIDRCTFLRKEEKHAYIRNIKSGLSEFEIILLYYHGLMRESGPLRALLEKYALLEEINFTYLIASNSQGRYDESAFGQYGERYRHKMAAEEAEWPCNKSKNSTSGV